MWRRYEHSSGAGFSFIELLAVTAIISILIFYALPKLSHLIDGNRLEQRQSAFLNTLKLAKLEAIKNTNSVISCRLNTVGFKCAGNKSTGLSNWSDGWITFIDINNDKLYQGSEQIIDTYRFSEGCKMFWNRGDYFSYFKFGVLKGGAKAGSFNISCALTKSKVTINWIGRARVSKP